MEKQINVTIQDETGRTDKVLVALLPEYSRSQIQHWLKSGVVTVEGEAVRASRKVVSGETLVITIPEPKELDLLPKGQGMVVHPSAGHPNGTLVNALLYHLKSLSSINDVIRPGIVHRIDKDTSGLLMVAKNNATHESLAQQLKDKTTLRKYVALVHGNISHDKGTINAPIGRSKTNRKVQAVIADGKPAVTHFTVLERFENFTLVELQLETGRTHQIRVHMQYIGFPLAGDPIYGPRKTLEGQGQYFHAKKLGFKHPKTGEDVVFEVPIPAQFENTLAKLKKID